jgi:flagellar biosynthesis/type III secretory pathway chaperone
METADNVYFAELIDELNNELSIYKELLSIAGKKTDILIKGNVKVLSEITGIEQDLVLKLGRIEARRFDIVKQIASFYKKDVSDVNASFFESILPPEELARFTRVFHELKNVLAELEHKNNTNEKLIKRALDYIKFSLEVITEVGKETSVYDARGKNSGEGALRLIDKKA